MTLNLSYPLQLIFVLASFCQGDNFSKFYGFTNAFLKTTITKAIKNLQAQDCSIFITGYRVFEGKIQKNCLGVMAPIRSHT